MTESIEVTVAVVVTPDMVDRAERTEPESMAWDWETSVRLLFEFADEIRAKRTCLFLVKNKL